MLGHRALSIQFNACIGAQATLYFSAQLDAGLLFDLAHNGFGDLVLARKHGDLATIEEHDRVISAFLELASCFAQPLDDISPLHIAPRNYAQ